MGKVRSEQVRRIVQGLLDQNPDKFTTDFENNKKVMESLTIISSKRLKNIVAGYATRLMSISKATEEVGEAEEEESENP